MQPPGTEALESLRPYLLHYALLQLRDRDSAEEVVQETMLAALEGRARFAGKSTAKTWLTGILKHKIIDLLRRRQREEPLIGDEDGSEADAVDAMKASESDVADHAFEDDMTGFRVGGAP